MVLRDVNRPLITALCASEEGRSLLDLLAILTPAFERTGKEIESPVFQQTLKKLLRTWVNPECLNKERLNGTEIPSQEYFSPGLNRSNPNETADPKEVGSSQPLLFSHDAIRDAQAGIAFYAERDKQRADQLAESSLLLQDASAAKFNRRLEEIKKSFE
jgi:hypothetical protein